MNKPTSLLKSILLFTLLSTFSLSYLFAQPANDGCTNAISLGTASTCISGVNSVTGQTLSGATADGGAITSTCTGFNGADVWYKFIAQCVNPTITISNKQSSWGSNTVKIQLLQGSCGSFTEVAGGGACATSNNSTANSTITPTANLVLGDTYYIRIYKSTTGNPTGLTWGFDICLTGTQTSRMSEVWKRTVLSNNVLNTPWEITYGPDDSLWVTESKGYKAYKMDPNTGVSRTILDISNGSITSELTPAEHTAFNVQFTSAQNPWPQGGFAGLAIHPQFSSGKPYVYISYVRKFDSASSSNASCVYFRNSLVRFTYDASTGKLKNPVALCDTLPGGNDHNSQRLIIVPIGGTNYLFYAQGDMGAGQLACIARPNHAQDTSYYEGKILRFNLEDDGDIEPNPLYPFNKWIPNDNPYNHNGTQSAIWDLGIRNNQGFAYNPATNVLYGSSHGPYTDDEINIIERYKNYGHPLVIGYAADGNYNGTTTPGLSTSYTAGETFATNSGISSLAPIGNEAANAAAINASGFAPYKDPLFSAYAAGGTGYPAATKTLAAIWSASPKPGNGAWPSEAWSGMDVYTRTLIPGWKNSLVVCGLKWGRVLRLKLDPTGTAIVQTNGADTVAYFQSKNRYRDLAISPNGRDLFISDEGTSASGPGGVAPPATVPNCTNCIIKYTFLGYADAGGKSSIPSSIDVTDTSTSSSAFINTVDSATTVVINSANNNTNLWVPITGPDGNIMAEIYANGNDLGTVRSAFYKNSGGIRIKNGVHYLDRNITITPDNQPSSSVKVRLYISKDEYDALDIDPASGVSAITDLKILKNSDACGAAISSSTTLITPTVAQAQGTSGYVLQGNITGFSSFYFAASNIVLPLQLINFEGYLKNNATDLLWETANEINVSHFIVERSIDNRNFTAIGNVSAHENTTLNSKYSFTDNDVINQSATIIYYRLKMVDVDGSYTYSKIVSVVLNPKLNVLLFPNPVKQSLNVQIKGATFNPVSVQIMDLTGRIIYSEKLMAAQSSIINIDVKRWKPQVYVLKITNSKNELLSTQKFEKL